MQKKFHPTDSRAVFVGRQKQIKQVLKLLLNNGKKWMVHIKGDGGIGKTRFLHVLQDEIRRRAETREWLCANIIDFYKPSNQTQFGLLNEIARRVGLEYFRRFEKQRKIYDEVLELNADKGQQQEAFGRVADAFIDDLRELLEAGNRIILLFDTCEEMQSIAYWMGQKFLPRLAPLLKELEKKWQANPHRKTIEKPGLIFVFAGRLDVRFPASLKSDVLKIELGPLNKTEFARYFKEGGILPGKITRKQLDQLYTRCGGRPLFGALSYDWLINEMGSAEELLDGPGPFSKKLVDWILRLRDEQSNVILATALSWRRMEADLLVQLLKIKPEKALELFASLGQYSFVKYREPDSEQNFHGSFQLHDVMRELVNYHIWPSEGRWTRQAMLDDVLAWYHERMDEPEVLEARDLPKTDEVRALLAEYLYYELEKNVVAGSRHGEALFKLASHRTDVSICELLNAEISRFERDLPDDRIDQLRFQQALVAFRREDFKRAREHWSALIRQPNTDLKLQATSHMILIELETYAGNYDLSLNHAEEADRIYQGLLHDAATAPGTSRHKLLKKEIGQLYNNWGYVYRAKSDWDDALKYYKDSLKFSSSKKHIARTLNNIGYVYFRKNNIEQALTYVGKALQLRKELDIPYELGLGYNTLGMIKENQGYFGEAARLYRTAKNYFDASHSDRGLALVYINLGRMMRVANDFEKSLNYLEMAERIFDEKNDITYLIVTLNEIGCAYRQRGGLEDRKEADKYLRRSLEYSQQIGDKKSEAENLEDLSELYYEWAKAVKRMSRNKASEMFKIVEDMTEQVTAIAETENLPYLLDKVALTTGDLYFEKENFERAFENLYKACGIVSQTRDETTIETGEYQRRLTKIADRLQERLHSLPTPGDTMNYTKKLLDKLSQEPENVQTNLQVVETKLRATLQLSNEISIYE